MERSEIDISSGCCSASMFELSIRMRRYLTFHAHLNSNSVINEPIHSGNVRWILEFHICNLIRLRHVFLNQVLGNVSSGNRIVLPADVAGGVEGSFRSMGLAGLMTVPPILKISLSEGESSTGVACPEVAGVRLRDR